MIMQLLHTLAVLLGTDQFSRGLFILAQESDTHIAVVHSSWPGPLKAVDLHTRQNEHPVASCTFSLQVGHQMEGTQTCLSKPVVSMLDWHLFKDKYKAPLYVNWTYLVLNLKHVCFILSLVHNHTTFQWQLSKQNLALRQLNWLFEIGCGM